MASAPLFDVWRTKMLFLLDGPGTDVFAFILRHGTNALTSNVDFKEYLTRLPYSSTANYLKLSKKNKKKQFHPSEMRQISGNRSWHKMGVSVLYKAIRLGCEDIASLDDAKWEDQNEMEGLIKKIKDERNYYVHEKGQIMNELDFQAKLNKLEGMFNKALTAAKVRYSVSDQNLAFVSGKVDRDISSIKKAQTMEEILAMGIVDVLPFFKETSKERLQTIYQCSQWFNPFSFLKGSPVGETDVQSIYCKTFLKHKEQLTQIADLDSVDLLTLTKTTGHIPRPSASTSTQGEKPHLILISGDAGSGKKTLLRYIISEWLRDSPDCRIKHLNEYDAILQILCRERNGPSLQDFLQQVLPNTFVGIKERLVAFLKECKVLFLLDGLDDLSQDSDSSQLVTDILNIGQYVPQFTVICTSRPESVPDFSANIPERYQQCKMEMKGVRSKHRTAFVLRHYDSFPSTSREDRDWLKYIMDNTGRRHLYEVPLNLLFAATLVYFEPLAMNCSTSENDLYNHVHELCIAKLQQRLAMNPVPGSDSLSRERSIRKVLSVMYQVALQSLLKDRVSLTKEEACLLLDHCKKEKLLSTDVMGAFLCVREEMIYRVPLQMYSVPHKSLQEFFAAQKIVENLNGEGLSRGTIRHMLQNPSKRQLSNLKNLLLHVKGLLCKKNVPPMPEAIKEVMDLLVEAGVENTIVVDHIIHYIKMKGFHFDYYRLVIRDSTVTCAAALLTDIPPRHVDMQLDSREVDREQLLLALGHHSLKRLFLVHHFFHPDPNHPPASDSVLRALPRSGLKWFSGHLSGDGIMLLQESRDLEVVSLAVSGNHYSPSAVSAISHVITTFRRLSQVGLHVPVQTVMPEIFTTPLPHLVVLALTGVDETVMDKTVKIITALQPVDGAYNWISFPGCRIEASVWRHFLTSLSDNGVRVENCGIKVPDTIAMTEEEEDELRTFARNKGLDGLWRFPDEELWM